ncbi:MAG: CinA family protein [Pseudomonadota bacterium]
MSPAAKIIDSARKKKVKIATAESCTAGMVAVALTEIAGSSAVVERGFVTYSNPAKIDMLGVLPSTLEAHGAVSEHVAREMAAGAVTHSQAQLSVSVTGIAGPGGSDFKPEGRVCFAIAGQLGTMVETIEFGVLGRSGVRTAACDHALGLLLRALEADLAP